MHLDIAHGLAAPRCPFQAFQATMPIELVARPSLDSDGKVTLSLHITNKSLHLNARTALAAVAGFFLKIDLEDEAGSEAQSGGLAMTYQRACSWDPIFYDISPRQSLALHSKAPRKGRATNANCALCDPRKMHSAQLAASHFTPSRSFSPIRGLISVWGSAAV